MLIDCSAHMGSLQESRRLIECVSRRSQSDVLMQSSMSVTELLLKVNGPMCLNFGGKEREKKKNLTGGLFLHICGFQTMNPDDLSSIVTAPPLCFRVNFIVMIPSSKLVLISTCWLNRASQRC